MRSNALQHLWVPLAVVAGIALTVTTFYPGQMPVDANLQLEQARSGVYDDWHPPLMSWVWSGLERLVAGPLGMLLLQNLMFWSGLGLAVGQLRWRPAAAALVVLAVGLYPPIFPALGTIWKDVGMGGALLLAFALFHRADRRDSLAALLGGLVALFYGLAVRHNAAPAVLPLALWAGVIAARRLRLLETRRRLAGWALGTLIFAALWVAVRLTNSALAAEHPLFTGQAIFAHDLAALSLATGTILVPDFMLTSEPAGVADLACLYDPRHATTLFHGNYGACAVRLHKVTDWRRFDALARAWRSAVRAHPAPYLAHRLRVFGTVLGLDRGRTCYPLAVGHDPNRLGLAFRRTAGYDAALNVAAWTAYRTPLFRAWLYLGAVGALLLFARRLPARRRGPALALGASAVLYGLAYFFVGVDCAFRLNWWLVVATPVLGLLLVDGWVEGRKADVPAGP